MSDSPFQRDLLGYKTKQNHNFPKLKKENNTLNLPFHPARLTLSALLWKAGLSSSLGSLGWALAPPFWDLPSTSPYSPKPPDTSPIGVMRLRAEDDWLGKGL